MKKLLIVPILTFLMFFSVDQTRAQVGNVGDLVKSGVDDSNLLMKSYLEPYVNGFGANLNTGWNNSARPYKKFGFDLRVNAAFAFIPTSDEFFDIGALQNQFQEVEVLNGVDFTPTVAGESDTRAIIGRTFTNPSNGQQEELFSFELPDGTGFGLVPTPMVQATVGLIKDTDISLRLVPTVNTPDVDGQVSLFGIGAKHGLNQWIPGGDLLPVDLSVQVGYTKFDFNIEAEVNPETGSDIHNSFNASEWEGQEIVLKSSGYTANLLVGKSIPIISVFGGVGFQSSTTDIAANGAYPVTVPNENYNPTTRPEPRAVESVTDPIDISVEGSNSVHALAGFRVRFGFIAVSGSYMLSNYPVANVGVGLSFR